MTARYTEILDLQNSGGGSSGGLFDSEQYIPADDHSSEFLDVGFRCHYVPHGAPVAHHGNFVGDREHLF